ncbi:putative uncharacterized protein DDB_G0279653 [Onthophagus taurus]|uniref:putative uncharacterized protein DDB_G0279653 n=1 Tax=Onthophagus taurus TaxID=166361 RepID=UPI000C1FFE43|nr:dual specificity protein kinase splB-like [Onthophagus taurus]
MYDYPTFQGSFEQQRGSSFTNPSQIQNQWNATQRGPPPNPAKLPREITDELAQRFTMRQKALTECKTGPSIEVIKRKFEVETPQPKPKSTLPKGTSSVVSFKKSSHGINNSLEESYWAQWKPTSSSFATNVVKEESFGKGRTHFTVNSVSNRCNVDSLTLCEGKKLMEEKSLKVIRKPMVIVESNSSEGDKHIQGKLFLCNPCDNPVNQNNSQCYQNYQQPYPTFTASMPNYHSIFYYGPSDHNYHERVKPCKRKESNKRCVKPRNNPDNYQKDNQINNQRDEHKKRPKSGIEKKEEISKKKAVKCKLSKSNEEMCKNHVRFCTKYHGDPNDDSESCCSRRDSTRTIEGYHGDVDTESQVDTRKYDDCHSYEDQEDTQESQEFHDNEDYPCYCHCCNKSYWMDDYNYSQSDNVSENSYLYNQYNYQVCRYQEESNYPSNHPNNHPNNHYSTRDKNESNSSFYCNQFKDSSYSSTSRITSSNPQIRKRQIERSCSTQSPVSRIACACNTEPKVCSNKACETLENAIKEKKIGDDMVGGLKVIKEKPETLLVSSSSRSDEYEQRHDDGCKCCSDAPCRQSSTGTTTTSTRPCKSSSPSSKDTLAVAVGSSRDNIQDEGSFVMDDGINHRGKEKRRYQSIQKCSHHCVSSGTSTEPVSNETANIAVERGVVDSRECFKEKSQSEKHVKGDESKITPTPRTQCIRKGTDSENFSKGKTSAGATLYKAEKCQTANSRPTSATQSRTNESIKPELVNVKSGNSYNNNSKSGSTQVSDINRKNTPVGTTTDRDSTLGARHSRSSNSQQQTVRSINNPSIATNVSNRSPSLNNRDNSRSPRLEAVQTNSSRPGSAGAQSRLNSGASPPTSIRGRSPNPSGAQPNNNNPVNTRPGVRPASTSPINASRPNSSVPHSVINSPESSKMGPVNREIHPETQQFIADSTQTGLSNISPTNKLGSTYTVMNQRGYVTNNPTRTPPSANSGTIPSITNDSTYMMNSALPEIIYSGDLNRSISRGGNIPHGASDGKYIVEKHIPIQNSYNESLNSENQAAGRPLSAYIPGIHTTYPISVEASKDPNLRHAPNNDGLRHFNPHENQVVYCVDTNQPDLKPHLPEVRRDDRHYRESYGVFPSESKNLGYVTTPKSLILQRNSRYMPLKGHTYTLKPPSNSCSRSWRSPKRKR